jgi:trehalose 6-phosphate phosphatase
MSDRFPVALADCALFLDLDSVLADAPDTDRLRLLLRQTHERLGGRLAIVSSRPIEDIDELLATPLPYVAGADGLQRRAGDAVDVGPVHPSLADAAAVFEALAGAQVGLLVERSRRGVIVRYHMAPTAEEAIVDCAERIAAATGLKLHAGDMMLELRSPGLDRGQTVRAFMEERSFARAKPVYIGEHAADGSGFAEAKRLGGFGVWVGEADEAHGDYRLDSANRVTDWLAKSLSRDAFDPADLV